MITVLMCEHDLWMLEGGAPKKGKLNGRGCAERLEGWSWAKKNKRKQWREGSTGIWREPSKA